jgi:hypothetical protein
MESAEALATPQRAVVFADLLDALRAQADVESVQALGWTAADLMLNNPPGVSVGDAALALPRALAALRAFTGSVDVARGATAAIASLARMTQLRAEVTSAGACEALAVAMQVHADDAQVQAQVCCGLRSLISDAAGLQRALDAGVPALLLETLQKQRKNAGVQHVGCRLLALLYDGDEVHARLFTAGAVDALLAALRTHSSHFDIQNAAILALMKFLRAAPPDVLDAARRLGGIEAAVLGLQTPTQGDLLVCSCCGVLKTLITEPEHYAPAGRAGVVAALAGVLPTPMEYVAREACKLLACILSEPENAARADAASAGQAALAVLRAHPSDAYVQAAGCSLLASLTNYFCSMPRHTDAAIQAALAAMQAHPSHEHVPAHACNALNLLIYSAPKTGRKAWTPGCIAAVVAALQAHRSSATVLLYGSNTLARLATFSNGARVQACEAGAVDALMTAFERAAADGTIEACGAAMQEVTRLPADATSAHVEAVVTPVVGALQMHRGNKKAHGMLLICFDMLLQSNGAAAAVAVRCGALHEVSASLRVHTPTLKRCCANILALLQSAAAAAADAAMAALLAEDAKTRAQSTPSRSKNKKRAGGGGGSQAVADASEAHAASAEAPVAAAASADATPAPAPEQPTEPPAAAPAPRSAEAERRRRRAAAKAARRAGSGDASASAAAADAGDAADGSSDAGGAGGDAANVGAPPHGLAILPTTAPATPPNALPRTAAPRPYLPPSGSEQLPPLTAAQAAAMLPPYLASLSFAAPILPLPPPPAPVAPAPPPPPPPPPVVKECCVCFLEVVVDELRLLSPCGHRCVCGDCATSLLARPAPVRTCPLCSELVVFATRVYDL